MDFRQLRYFLGIVEAGSISAAAAQLHVAQPALSQQLARLEAELGTALLVRGPRGVMPTAAGEALRDHARILLRDLERASEAVRAEAGGPVRGSVTIGLPTTVAMALTLPLLRTMRDRHPGISLHLAESQSGHLLDWLHQGKADVIVLFELPGELGRGLRRTSHSPTRRHCP
jgi:LysR family nitrogen assimilation transcriptional regulator